MGNHVQAYVERLCVDRPRRWLKDAFDALSLTVVEYHQIEICLSQQSFEDVGDDEVAIRDLMSVTVFVLGKDVSFTDALLSHDLPSSSRVMAFARVSEAGAAIVVRIREVSRQRSAFWSFPSGADEPSSQDSPH